MRKRKRSTISAPLPLPARILRKPSGERPNHSDALWFFEIVFLLIPKLLQQLLFRTMSAAFPSTRHSRGRGNPEDSAYGERSLFPCAIQHLFGKISRSSFKPSTGSTLQPSKAVIRNRGNSCKKERSRRCHENMSLDRLGIDKLRSVTPDKKKQTAGSFLPGDWRQKTSRDFDEVLHDETLFLPRSTIASRIRRPGSLSGKNDAHPFTRAPPLGIGHGQAHGQRFAGGVRN